MVSHTRAAPWVRGVGWAGSTGCGLREFAAELGAYVQREQQVRFPLFGVCRFAAVVEV
ncbi:hypothetical protein SAMN04487905_107247 [Actinopolyspora xinjiangensis]|uniref:Uncharacterized protein n=1 Tax=Actinopolyspora xinjiangensis TaxID=405564 RepID=A0A1H0UZ82_9ACTN|nr:hypothetical protein [Actinopolyspora xinjiangensis]SDP71572.1 hypothetical protein SAMN04487905_107247 [Actinopolyspora xinjiangensis]